MTQFYQYRSALRAATAWTEPFTNEEVRFGTLSLTTLAEHLQVGTSSIILDDPDANLGHSGDGILGLHRFELVETDAVADGEHVVITFIGERKYRRGDGDRPGLRTGAQRQIELQLLDLNCIPSLRIIDPDDEDAVRPEETVTDRLTWLLGSDYLLNAVHDDGLVDANTTLMDAVPAPGYGGQTAASVISDCELAAGYGWNAWIYYEEDAGHYSLAFLNANTSTDYSSTLRISNVLADLDTVTAAQFLTGTTFAASYDAELTRDPSSIVSGVLVPYRDSSVFRERESTRDLYGPREQSAPNTNIRSSTRAIATAEDFLDQHATDSDNIHVAIEVPTSKANAIKAGHRIEVKFSHLPGYESFTWCRVIRRTIIQETAPDRYVIDMDLSPQETEPVVTSPIIQSAFDRGGLSGVTLTLPNPVTIGDILVVITSARLDYDPDAPNISGVLPRWGAGAWTRFNGANITSPDGSPTGNGISAYWKVADSTEQSGIIQEQNSVAGIWELSSTMDPASATITWVDQELGGTDYDIGTTATVATGEIALAGWCIGTRPGSWPWDFSNSYPWQTPNPLPGIDDGWTIRISKWSYDHYSVHAYLPAEPWSVLADAEGTGVALGGSIQPGHTGKTFGGLIIVIPPV